MKGETDMCKKNKWSFIEDKELREGMVMFSDELKACAKAYYVKYKTCYHEIMEPYESICSGICGGDGSMKVYVSPELNKMFGDEIKSRCKEEETKFQRMLVNWDFLLNYAVIFHAIPKDKVDYIRNQIWDDLTKMKIGILGKQFCK